MYTGGCTPDELLGKLAARDQSGNCGMGDYSWTANMGREVVIKAYKCGRGTPVPVNINLV